MSRKTAHFIALYLGAIVVANLIVTFAPADWRGAIIILNAFTLIALDLTAGDHLHEVWAHNGLLWKIGLLIVNGAAISYAMNSAAGPVALASVSAFALSAAADRLTYAALHTRSWYVRANSSNALGAVVDSVTFLSGLAIAGILPWSSVPLLAAGQIVAKTAGGAIWTILLRRPAAVQVEAQR